jgi:hypothetical protein
MTAALAIVAQLLPILAQLPGDISALLAWIASVRQTAQQSAEWTPDMEKAFLASLQALGTSPEQLPDTVAMFDNLTDAQKALVQIAKSPAAAADALALVQPAARLTAAQIDQAENKARATSGQVNPFERAR